MLQSGTEGTLLAAEGILLAAEGILLRPPIVSRDSTSFEGCSSTCSKSHAFNTLSVQHLGIRIRPVRHSTLPSRPHLIHDTALIPSLHSGSGSWLFVLLQLRVKARGVPPKWKASPPGRSGDGQQLRSRLRWVRESVALFNLASENYSIF